MKKKTVALLLACCMVLGVAIGGTMAWLTSNGGTVTNTFTVGDIDITLSETDTDNSGNRDYAIVPGDKKAKDPVVTFTKDSEACYLFVKMTVANNACTVGDKTADPIIDWEIADGWTFYDAENEEAYSDPPAYTKDGSYYLYRILTKEEAQKNAAYYVLKGEGTGDFENGYVTVSEDVVKEMLEGDDGITKDGKKPTLTFVAAAVQSDNLAVDNGEQTALQRVVEQLPDGFIVVSD